jgi:hypothetical protein
MYLFGWLALHIYCFHGLISTIQLIKQKSTIQEMLLIMCGLEIIGKEKNF